MQQNTTILEIVLILLGVVTGTISLTWNIISFFKHRRNQIYDYGEAIIENYLEKQIDHPEFRDGESILKLHETRQIDKLTWAKYEAFCLYTWNSLETIQHKYGQKTKKAPFIPAVLKIIRRHKQVFDEMESTGTPNDMFEYLRKEGKLS